MLLHKHIPIGAMDKLPFYRFQMLVDTWIKELEEEKKERKRQEEEQRREQKKQSNMMNTNSMRSSMPSMPKR